MSSSISNIIKKVVPVFLIIVLGILMFWDKGENFLTPNTFNNIGDTCFPLNMDYASSFLYSWWTRGNFGFGRVNTALFILPMNLSVWLWSILGLPLWIANRLWHVLPNILIGIGAFYLYRSLFKSRYSWICGIIASAFIMLLPGRNIFPHGSMGFAGTLFILGASIRGLFPEYSGSSKRNAVIMFSLGTAMAVYDIRGLYVTLIIVGLIIALTFYFYRKKKQNYIPTFKFISSCIILALLLNLFWIIPLSLQLTHGRASLVPASKILEQREAFDKVHQKMANPAYILRAAVGGSETESPPHFYFSHPLILPFSFLIPIYCFLPLLIRKVDRKIKLLVFGAVFLTLYPVTFHISPTINMFLRNHIPTFWTMRKPEPWLYYVGVCYGLIVGSMTEHFLKLMKDDKAKKAIFVGCVSIVVLIFGGGILLDKAIVPGFYSKYTLFFNKLPYVKIPEEYDKVEKYLTKYARATDRVWYIDVGNYKRYTWSYKGHQPEILFFKSPIPAVGRPLTWATPMIDLLSDSVDSKKHGPEEGLNLALLLGKISNIKYLFLHKDYYYHKVYYSKNDRDLNNYVRKNVIQKRDFKVVMDTNKFTLYENKDFSLSPIYSSGTAIAIAGDLDTLSWIAQANPHIQKPLFVFVKQIKSMEKPTPATRAFIFANSNPLDLALQSLEPDYGVKISDSKKPIVFKVKEEGWYQVWKRGKASQASGLRPPALGIRMDGKEVIQDTIYRIEDRGMKWKRIGRIELKKGRHRLVVEEVPLELVIVPEEKLVKVEERVQDYLKKAKVLPTYFLSRELNGEVDSQGKKLLKRSFYVPSPEKYSLRAKISPQYIEAPDYGLKQKMGRNLEEWSSVSRNVRYFTSTEKDILTVGTYFDGDSGEREFLGLKRDIKPVNIEYYPNFEINYRLPSPGVQKCEIILGIDLDNDGKIDTRVSEKLPSYSEKEFNSYSFDLYERVRDSLGQDLPANFFFHLVKVYLKVSKKDGLDCSVFPNKGWHQISFKNFGLYDFSEGKCVKKRNYAFNERIGRSSESPPVVILSRSFENLDLEKYPFVNLIHQNEDSRSLLVSITLYLDFNHDGKSDGKVTYKGVTAEHPFFDAYQLARTKFPDQDLYHLIKLEIRLSKNSEIATAKTRKETERRKEKQGRESIFLQHLQIYGEEILPYEKARPISPVLKVDQKKLSLTKSSSWYIAQPTYLKEGYHNLDAIFPGLDTKLDFIIIEPVSRIKDVKSRWDHVPLRDPGSRAEPEITFQKVNPTKYRVKVKNATEPFWLVFSESFHEGWRAYVEPQVIRSLGHQVISKKEEGMEEIVAGYPRLGVKETKHLQRFTPSDIKYLFRETDVKEHYLVNGYANAWYVPVSQLASLPVSRLTNQQTNKPTNQAISNEQRATSEMEIVLYFWSQSLFYLSLIISGTTLVGCIGYLVGTGVRRKRRRAGGQVKEWESEKGRNGEGEQSRYQAIKLSTNYERNK